MNLNTLMKKVIINNELIPNLQNRFIQIFNHILGIIIPNKYGACNICGNEIKLINKSYKIN